MVKETMMYGFDAFEFCCLKKFHQILVVREQKELKKTWLLVLHPKQFHGKLIHYETMLSKCAPYCGWNIHHETCVNQPTIIIK